jgi:uncharacterized repeat protein (TIGR03806 family)
MLAANHCRSLAASAGIVAIMVTFATHGFAQAPAKAAKDFACRWTETPIVIDGKADDAAWKHAQLIDNFSLPWLKDKARPARMATRARLLWDREYLYFLAEMDDTDLYADVKEHDGQTWDNDVFELFFKPASDKPGYYEFQVNAAGTIMDLFLPRRGAGGFQRFKKDITFHIDAKVTLRGTLNNWTDKDEGWTVEGRVPWTDFLRTGGRPNPGESWSFALCRYDYSVDFEGPELSTCAPLSSKPHPDFHHFEDYATLRFVGPTPTAMTKLEPLTTSRVVGSPEPLPPFRVAKVFPNHKIDFPIQVIRQPQNRLLLYIGEVSAYGRSALYRIPDDPAPAKPETLIEFDGVAYDVTFHPKFSENGYVYVGWNGPLSGGAKTTRVSRYTMQTKAPFRFDPKSETRIIEWPSDGHNGGAIAFGLDGMLYITSGDGTSDSDTNVKGQGLDHLLSKVLRIDVDHPEPGKVYSVPKDNPFVGQPNVRPETWAYGLRNPWRITVDSKTGHVWVGQNGQDLWEQAYLVRKGDNYGWSVYEGSHPFYLNRQLGPHPHVKPTIEHHHAEFRSLTGGVVYHGQRFPELQGAYIYGDYSTGKIWAMRHDGEKVHWHKELASTTLRITGFGIDSRGELLICDHRANGGFYTLERTPVEAPKGRFPRKLSESGLFESVKDHRMVAGVIPYKVNAPLWSDGAHKERFLAMPHKAGQPPVIETTRNRGWNFPDETVLIKSFALESEDGNPRSRRWIETRFLTKQQGEWVGYSYRWNDDQTDAELVSKEGADAAFTIATANGPRKQAWRYPSRTECMVCHSRAANYVLGLTNLQMNCDHTYGRRHENQLRLLEQLGLLRVDWRGEAVADLRDQLRAKKLDEKQIDEFIAKQTATRDQRQAVTSTLLSTRPENEKRLVDPYDRKLDLDLRARSYLHANCSICHVEAGGGNAQLDLEFGTAVEKRKYLDVKPVHHTFGMAEARLVAPGDPARSVLLHRVGMRDAGFMPPLATSVVDRQAVELFRDWIRSMKPAKAQGSSGLR